jgi:hypothetical protein
VIDPDGHPVVGATVTCLEVSGLTGADGTFSLPGVPTVQGEIHCTITFVTPDGRTLTGTVTGIPPVPGGITEVGTTTVIEAHFEAALGRLVATCDDCSVAFALPFPFPFFHQTYTTVFVNNNGHLTFSFDEGDYTETIGEFTWQPRISAFWDDLIVRLCCGQPAPANAGLYVNDQFPDRFVVTWFHQQEYCCVGDSTIQAILFADGRIQFAYNGVTALDAIVGITPGGAAPVLQVDYATDLSFSTTGPTTILEQFTTPFPNGTTDRSGSGLGAENRFNLDRRLVIFTPNASGGYDVRVLLP